MNLISCGVCGAVLDKNRITEPEMMMVDFDGKEIVNMEVACWHNGDFKPTIKCPCCKFNIFYETGEET